MTRVGVFIAFILALVIGNAGCRPNSSVDVAVDANQGTASQPTIAVTPAEREGSQFLLTGDTANLTVNAPGASRAEFLYMPITTSDRALLLKTIDAPDNGKFALQLNLPEDLNGEIWARVSYPDGESRESEHLQIARKDTVTTPDVDRSSNTNGDVVANSNQSGKENPDSDDSDESAREDNVTGSRIQKTALKRGGKNIRITVNVPAFLLTLWQDGKEVATYNVGVGRKQYPIPSGMRSTDKIILNPDWIPPDSAWVRKSEHQPYERIPASDADNPLGKIKVPLGDAYLLHEAQGPSDIGNLVSHGCVRVLQDDIFDLTQKIAAGLGLDISSGEINTAKNDSKRRVLDLGEEMPVDINYDTMVVEGGILRIFPDVYEKGMNTVDNLEKELQSYGVDTSKFSKDRLEEMLDKVEKGKKLVVPLDSLKAGRLEDVKLEKLIPRPAKGSS